MAKRNLSIAPKSSSDRRGTSAAGTSAAGTSAAGTITADISAAGVSAASTSGASAVNATLAPVQRQTLDFLRSFISERGYAPSLKEIAEHIGVKSLSTAHFHLERLEDKGFIKRGEDGTLEFCEVSRPVLGPTAIPLVGTIAAGLPIDAVETSATIDVPPSMLRPGQEVFCLEVSGNSMVDEHICDGDIIVVNKTSSADDGSIVVALLDDGTATLKRYRRLKNGKVMLIPANPTMTPMTVDNVTIQGTLVGVIREL